MLQPQVLDLNHTLLDMEKMLRRLLGEDIELSLLTTRPVHNVHADPGQIGQIVMNLPILAAALPHVRAGRLKALAVTSGKRASVAAEIPTLAESAGLPGYEAAQWQGLIAPAGTPADVVTKINAELNRALQLPDVKERIGNLGVEFAPNAPPQFATDIKADIAKWDQLIRSLGIRLD